MMARTGVYSLVLVMLLVASADACGGPLRGLFQRVRARRAAASQATCAQSVYAQPACVQPTRVEVQAEPPSQSQVFSRAPLGGEVRSRVPLPDDHPTRQLRAKPGMIYETISVPKEKDWSV